ncbi:MAG: NUDIX hydrolase [Elusimicrobiota bacterium]|nr:MAG: NUDIX hydrolase [Elusimicrobiota bacterium]
MRTFSVRAYGVLRDGDKVLLTLSRFGDRTFVNFPGGGVEIEEGPGDGLLREFREETGLVVRPARILHASQKAHLSTQAPIQIVSLYWLVERVSGDLRLTGNGDDVLELFWSPVNALPLDRMFPADLEFCALLPGLLAP